MKAQSLHTNNLTLGYRQGGLTTTLHTELNFTFQPGELIAIVGNNGTGKSTLLKTISGLLPPLAGQVLFGEKDIHNILSSERAQLLSLVLTQMPSGQLTGNDLVAIGRYPWTGWTGRLNDGDYQLMQQALEVTQSFHFAHKKVHQLSDGQRQRLMIARALAQDTPVILMDEPTSHLDPSGRMAVMEILHELSTNHGKTILLVTHEVELALQFADRMLILSNELPPVYDVPQALIQSGALAERFASDNMVFDAETARFKRKQ